MSDDTPCDLPLEDLVALADGELSQAASARVERHLAACDACRHEAALLARAGSAILALPSVEPSAGFADRVLAASRATDARTTDIGPAAATPRGRLVRFWPAAAVAAALLAAFFLKGRGPETTPVDGGGEVAQEISEEELLEIAENLPLLANLETLREVGNADSLIALIDNLDLLESVETQALDALDQLIADGDGG